MPTEYPLEFKRKVIHVIGSTRVASSNTRNKKKEISEIRNKMSNLRGIFEPR